MKPKHRSVLVIMAPVVLALSVWGGTRFLQAVGGYYPRNEAVMTVLAVLAASFCGVFVRHVPWKGWKVVFAGLALALVFWGVMLPFWFNVVAR